MRGLAKIGAIAAAILVLAGLLVTGIGKWRESAHRARCQFHLSRVGLFALWNVTDPAIPIPKDDAERSKFTRIPDQMQPDPNKYFPAGTVANAAIPPTERLSVFPVLLPYLQQGVVERMDLNQGWNADANHEPATTLIPYLVCPSQFRRHEGSNMAPTHFLGMAGLGSDAPKLMQSNPRAGMFRYDDATRVGALQRGLSYSVSFVEASTSIGPWIAGGPATVRGVDSEQKLFGRRAQFGGNHPNGCNVAYADGSVRFAANDMTHRVFGLLATLAEQTE
jgi:prepilin-type processing-associated H-X9-DG protein